MIFYRFNDYQAILNYKEIEVLPDIGLKKNKKYTIELDLHKR